MNGDSILFFHNIAEPPKKLRSTRYSSSWLHVWDGVNDGSSLRGCVAEALEAPNLESQCGTNCLSSGEAEFSFLHDV